MQYTYTELAAYLLLYSFIGWALEVAFFAVKERRFCNRGFFSLPFCPEYGIMMDILILLLPEQGTKWLLQFLTTWMVVSVVEYFSGGIAAKIWKKHLWNYEDVTLFGGKKKSVLLSLIKAAVVMTAVLLLHPPVFILFSMIPTIVLRIIDIVGFGLMAADLVSILIAVRKSRSLTELKETQGRLLQEQKEVKQKLGGKIYHAVWKRLNRAYPEMEALEEADRAERYVFARGVCVDKLIWVFMICAFLGDLIETLFCRVTGGVWMSRSSVIYGTFSIVWGFGAVILTVVLQRLAGKEARYIFLAGSVLGGVYEYLCSVFTEIFLGTTFWDYSDMPFNIGGRTNLLYCIFWGLLSVVWVKICYPTISGWIEKLPPLGAKIATWAVVVLMSCDAVISAGAMVRYVERQDSAAVQESSADAGTAAGVENAAKEESVADAGTVVGTESTTGTVRAEKKSVIDTFFDINYPDERIEKVWPNMKVEVQ